MEQHDTCTLRVRGPRVIKVYEKELVKAQIKKPEEEAQKSKVGSLATSKSEKLEAEAERK